jgi:hypothetical protein
MAYVFSLSTSTAAYRLFGVFPKVFSTVGITGLKELRDDVTGERPYVS